VLSGSIIKAAAAAVLALCLAGCGSGPPGTSVIGEAYVGPAELKIRSDIPLQSSTVATVKHGDRLEILQARRRFLRVRTPRGAEGWTDERQLLSTADMAALRELAERAAAMPVQGQATTYSDLNVHTQPARQSPSFVQVKEKEKMDVLTHMATPRADAPRKPLIAPTPKKAKAAAKKPAKKEAKYPPPPMPKPPAPPSDWLELSNSDQPDEPAPAEEEIDDKTPAPVDEWSLIRTASGQAGWVLTRRLVMAIPDEVAQYAEGHRIVSYFSLGEVRDGDQKKRTWLWTTIGAGTEPYDFDSFRVFVWSQRRHRYETAYIERNLKGYAPVLLREVKFSERGKVKGEAVNYPGFSICIEKKDGQRYRLEYALPTAETVRFAGERSCEAPSAPLVAVKAPALLPSGPAPAPPPAETFTARLKKRLHAITGRWFGK
jgi:SH3-like domain-containing protein